MHPIKLRIIVTILMSVFFAQSFSAITTQSSTWDETHYFGIGKYLLKHHRWDVMGSISHPPISYYMSSLPLMFTKDDETLWHTHSEDITFLSTVDIVRGQTLLSSKANEGDRLLILSRLMFAFLGVILGCYVFLFSKHLYGVKGAVTSLFFYTFCPNMLGLSSISLPDFPLTAFSFIFIYYLWRSLNENSKVNQVWAGLALGLALLSKLTALILFPTAIILCFISSKVSWWKSISSLIIIYALAFLILLSGYNGDLVPYFQGVELQLSALHTSTKFFLGENSTIGWWYYYPVDFALKTPIPVLVLFVLSFVIICKKSGQNLRDGLFLIVPIFLIFVLFCANRSGLGIRYILAIYPFIYVMIGVVATYGRHYRKLIYVLGIWSVISSLYIAPHYLSYFNEFVGGPGNGYKYVLDSDYGQDLKELKKYLDKHGIERITFSYFGTDSPQRYGIVYDWLPSFFLYNPNYGSGLSDAGIYQNRYLAVSANNIQGTFLANKDMFKWLMKYEPVAKAGYTIFIYDLATINNKL